MCVVEELRAGRAEGLRDERGVEAGVGMVEVCRIRVGRDATDRR